MFDAINSILTSSELSTIFSEEDYKTLIINIKQINFFESLNELQITQLISSKLKSNIKFVFLFESQEYYELLFNDFPQTFNKCKIINSTEYIQYYEDVECLSVHEILTNKLSQDQVQLCNLCYSHELKLLPQNQFGHMLSYLEILALSSYLQTNLEMISKKYCFKERETRILNTKISIFKKKKESLEKEILILGVSIGKRKDIIDQVQKSMDLLNSKMKELNGQIEILQDKNNQYEDIFKQYQKTEKLFTKTKETMTKLQDNINSNAFKAKLLQETKANGFIQTKSFAIYSIIFCLIFDLADKYSRDRDISQKVLLELSKEPGQWKITRVFINELNRILNELDGLKSNLEKFNPFFVSDFQAKSIFQLMEKQNMIEIFEADNTKITFNKYQIFIMKWIDYAVEITRLRMHKKLQDSDLPEKQGSHSSFKPFFYSIILVLVIQEQLKQLSEIKSQLNGEIQQQETILNEMLPKLQNENIQYFENALMVRHFLFLINHTQNFLSNYSSAFDFLDSKRAQEYCSLLSYYILIMNKYSYKEKQEFISYYQSLGRAGLIDMKQHPLYELLSPNDNYINSFLCAESPCNINCLTNFAILDYLSEIKFLYPLIIDPTGQFIKLYNQLRGTEKQLIFQYWTHIKEENQQCIDSQGHSLPKQFLDKLNLAITNGGTIVVIEFDQAALSALMPIIQFKYMQVMEAAVAKKFQLIQAEIANEGKKQEESDWQDKQFEKNQQQSKNQNPSFKYFGNVLFMHPSFQLVLITQQYPNGKLTQDFLNKMVILNNDIDTNELWSETICDQIAKSVNFKEIKRIVDAFESQKQKHPLIVAYQHFMEDLKEIATSNDLNYKKTLYLVKEIKKLEEILKRQTQNIVEEVDQNRPIDQSNASQQVSQQLSSQVDSLIEQFQPEETEQQQTQNSYQLKIYSKEQIKQNQQQQEQQKEKNDDFNEEETEQKTKIKSMMQSILYIAQNQEYLGVVNQYKKLSKRLLVAIHALQNLKKLFPEQNTLLVSDSTIMYLIERSIELAEIQEFEEKFVIKAIEINCIMQIVKIYLHSEYKPYFCLLYSLEMIKYKNKFDQQLWLLFLNGDVQFRLDSQKTIKRDCVDTQQIELIKIMCEMFNIQEEIFPKLIDILDDDQIILNEEVSKKCLEQLNNQKQIAQQFLESTEKIVSFQKNVKKMNSSSTYTIKLKNFSECLSTQQDNCINDKAICISNDNWKTFFNLGLQKNKFKNIIESVIKRKSQWKEFQLKSLSEVLFKQEIKFEQQIQSESSDNMKKLQLSDVKPYEKIKKLQKYNIKFNSEFNQQNLSLLEQFLVLQYFHPDYLNFILNESHFMTNKYLLLQNIQIYNTNFSNFSPQSYAQPIILYYEANQENPAKFCEVFAAYKQLQVVRVNLNQFILDAIEQEINRVAIKKQGAWLILENLQNLNYNSSVRIFKFVQQQINLKETYLNFEVFFTFYCSRTNSENIQLMKMYLTPQVNEPINHYLQSFIAPDAVSIYLKNQINQKEDIEQERKDQQLEQFETFQLQNYSVFTNKILQKKIFNINIKPAIDILTVKEYPPGYYITLIDLVHFFNKALKKRRVPTKVLEEMMKQEEHNTRYMNQIKFTLIFVFAILKEREKYINNNNQTFISMPKLHFQAIIDEFMTFLQLFSFAQQQIDQTILNFLQIVFNPYNYHQQMNYSNQTIKLLYKEYTLANQQDSIFNFAIQETDYYKIIQEIQSEDDVINAIQKMPDFFQIQQLGLSANHEIQFEYERSKKLFTKLKITQEIFQNTTQLEMNKQNNKAFEQIKVPEIQSVELSTLKRLYLQLDEFLQTQKGQLFNQKKELNFKLLGLVQKISDLFENGLPQKEINIQFDQSNDQNEQSQTNYTKLIGQIIKKELDQYNQQIQLIQNDLLIISMHLKGESLSCLSEQILLKIEQLKNNQIPEEWLKDTKIQLSLFEFVQMLICKKEFLITILFETENKFSPVISLDYLYDPLNTLLAFLTSQAQQLQCSIFDLVINAQNFREIKNYLMKDKLLVQGFKISYGCLNDSSNYLTEEHQRQFNYKIKTLELSIVKKQTEKSNITYEKLIEQKSIEIIYEANNLNLSEYNIDKMYKESIKKYEKLMKFSQIQKEVQQSENLSEQSDGQLIFLVKLPINSYLFHTQNCKYPIKFEMYFQSEKPQCFWDARQTFIHF